MKVLVRKLKHFLGYIKKEAKCFKSHKHNFGLKIALLEFFDGIFPPGKRSFYINSVDKYVTKYLSELILEFKNADINNYQIDTLYEQEQLDHFPIWCCWWQGEETMPEIVKMCYHRLKDKIPSGAKLHLITLDNYLEWIEIPKFIKEKFENNIITMTTMSDILRMCLLNKYGGYWIDATVFFTDDIPKEYFEKNFYCQKMDDPIKCKREACKGKWCGFSMAGKNDNILFLYMKEAFFKWWENYDDIVDYVLIDYILLAGYKNIPSIKKCIDEVENNNEDIFEMYQVLNEPYSKELYNELTKRNVMHKLTYKMDLKKYTEDGKITLYGWLLKDVFGENYVTK